MYLVLRALLQFILSNAYIRASWFGERWHGYNIITSSTIIAFFLNNMICDKCEH